MSTIPSGQLVRFEQPKGKICKEIKSFEERLTCMVLGTQSRIIAEMSLIKGRLEEHRKYVRGKLEEYVKKIASDLANLRYEFRYIHNDLYEFEYVLCRIRRIVSRRGYHGAVNLWYELIGNQGKSSSEKKTFACFLKKFKDFQRKGSTITPEISNLRDKIKGIRSKLFDLQFKIPIIEENDYRDWKIMDAVNKFRTEDKTLQGLATSVHNEILGLISDFEKIEVMKGLKESIKPIQDRVEHPLLSYIKEMTDAPALLRKSASRVDELGLEIKKVKLRLENEVRINGYLKATDPSVHFKYEKPRFESLDKIDELISTISKNVEAITDMEGWIKLGFKGLKQRYVTQYGPAGILDEPTVFSKHISTLTTDLKKELQKYITTLETIKSIYEQLKEIKDTKTKQETAMKEGITKDELNSSSLEKIKPIIEEFVAIRSNIDTIDRHFFKKQEELRKKLTSELKVNIRSSIL